MDVRDELRNSWLSELPTAELDAIRPLLQRTKLSDDAVLHELEAPIDNVYFPESSLLSAYVPTAEGEVKSIMLVGPESVLGYGAAFGIPNSPWQVRVLIAG